jgi:hypothetical protein
MPSTEAPPAALTGVMSGALAEMVDTLVNLDAAISGLIAARTEMLENVRIWSELAESAAPHSTPTSREIAFRSLRAEVACALRLPERTVERLFGEARMLVRDLPRTMNALRDGAIGYRHAQVMVDHGAGLPAADLETFERLAVPTATTSTAAAFDRAARKIRESLDPSTLETRTAAAVELREAALLPARDGMSDIYLHIPAPEAQAIWTRATEEATRRRKAGDARTLTQLRVDVMSDALLTGTFAALEGRQVRPDVFVTVPVLSLLGLSDEPASLDGDGPIALSTARKLAAHAPSFVRILTHPETGAILSVGRDRYSVPADLKTALRVRDGTCGFVGCSRDASFCDIDHTVDWTRDGTTALGNLAFLCRGHHTLKHASAWAVTQAEGGVLDWVSPAGRRYQNRPSGWVTGSAVVGAGCGT